MNSISKIPGPTPLAALVGAVAAAVLAWQGWVWFDQHRADDRREEAVRTAEAQVLALTTMQPSTVESTLEDISSRLSGEFKGQFEAFSENFLDSVKGNKVTSEGEVRGSAVVDYRDGESASVIIASSAQVTEGRKKPVERHWRFRVVLEQSDDKWLVNGMEFVQ